MFWCPHKVHLNRGGQSSFHLDRWDPRTDLLEKKSWKFSVCSMETIIITRKLSSFLSFRTVLRGGDFTTKCSILIQSHPWQPVNMAVCQECSENNTIDLEMIHWQQRANNLRATDGRRIVKLCNPVTHDSLFTETCGTDIEVQYSGAHRGFFKRWPIIIIWKYWYPMCYFCGEGKC